MFLQRPSFLDVHAMFEKIDTSFLSCSARSEPWGVARCNKRNLMCWRGANWLLLFSQLVNLTAFRPLALCFYTMSTW
jgi:hypothetical protein